MRAVQTPSKPKPKLRRTEQQQRVDDDHNPLVDEDGLEHDFKHQAIRCLISATRPKERRKFASRAALSARTGLPDGTARLCHDFLPARIERRASYSPGTANCYPTVLQLSGAFQDHKIRAGGVSPRRRPSTFERAQPVSVFCDSAECRPSRAFGHVAACCPGVCTPG